MISSHITADLKNAMLNRDTVAVSVLRMLQAELKNAQIAKMADLSEADEIGVVRKEIKKRIDAATAYRQAHNEERAVSEESEAHILEAYLPPAADPEAVRAFLREAAAGMTLEPKHRGELIRKAMTQFDGSLDGQTAATLVNELFL